MARKYSYKYPMHAVTVDCVIFGLDEDELKVMLIQRGEKTFKDQWALPGIDKTVHRAGLW